MNPHRHPGLVLAVHPTSKGFGWVVFEGPLAPVDWGIAGTKTHRSATAMRRLEGLLDQYHPSVVLFEAYEEGQARRGERIRELTQSMRACAENRDITVFVYSRALIAKHLLGKPKATRHEIAEAVSKLLPIFRPRLPRARELWHSEDTRQSLFDAGALAITHFEVSRPPLDANVKRA